MYSCLYTFIPLYAKNIQHKHSTYIVSVFIYLLYEYLVISWNIIKRLTLR